MAMLLRSVLLATLIAPPSAFAATTPLTVNDQLTACSAEPSGDKRLACYDGIAKQAQPLAPGTSNGAPPATAEQDSSTVRSNDPKTGDIHGHWITSVEVDAMTDAKTVSFENLALPGQSENGVGAKIGVFCMNRQMHVAWISQAYLGNYESSIPNVTYRIDSQQPRSERWYTGSNLAYPSDPVPLVQAITDAKRLVFQVRGFDYESHQAVFDLDGIREVLDGLSECWPPAPPPPPSPTPTASSAGKPATAPASAAARHKAH